MGKSLIIKGADFSANAIVGAVEWYNEYENLVGDTNTNTLNWMGFNPSAIVSLLKGKPIDVVKFSSKGGNNTTIFIGAKKILSAPGVSPVESEDVANEYEYTVTPGENVIRLRESIVLGDNETITFRQPNGDILKFFANGTLNDGLPFLSASQYYSDQPRKMPFMCGHIVY